MAVAKQATRLSVEDQGNGSGGETKKGCRYCVKAQGEGGMSCLFAASRYFSGGKAG